MVYNWKNHTAMTGFVKEKLRVIWKANPKVWLTTSLCQRYVSRCLLGRLIYLPKQPWIYIPPFG